MSDALKQKIAEIRVCTDDPHELARRVRCALDCIEEQQRQIERLIEAGDVALNLLSMFGGNPLVTVTAAKWEAAKSSRAGSDEVY